MKNAAIAALCFLVLSLATLLDAQAQPHAQAQPQRVGGPCAYNEVPGVFDIVSVAPVPPGQETMRPPYPPFRVLFTFKPDRPAPEVAHLLGRVHPLRLTSGADPGPEFLKRYGIRPGVRFTGAIRVIRSGTCTPFLFHLNGVDTSDLFEYHR